MEGSAPAQVYSLVFGLLLVAGGIIGFFYDATFAVGDSVSSDEALSVLAVNGWHNVVHIVTGVVGLACFGSYFAARLYAFALGVVYTLLGIVGLVFLENPDYLFDVVPLNLEDNILHLLIGVAGILAALATDSEPAPTTQS